MESPIRLAGTYDRKQSEMVKSSIELEGEIRQVG